VGTGSGGRPCRARGRCQVFRLFREMINRYKKTMKVEHFADHIFLKKLHSSGLQYLWLGCRPRGSYSIPLLHLQNFLLKKFIVIWIVNSDLQIIFLEDMICRWPGCWYSRHWEIICFVIFFTIEDYYFGLKQRAHRSICCTYDSNFTTKTPFSKRCKSSFSSYIKSDWAHHIR
jgi:hypothetical protein